MLSFFRRLIYALSNKIWQRNPENLSEGRLTVDFSKVKKSPFDIKSESSYNAYLSNGSFTLGLRKANCIAWVDIPDQEYEDHVIDAKIRMESLGGYAATGIIFRIMDEDSYYMALVSSKGYFRLDVIKNNTPKTLIAWTEVSDFNGTNISIKIITYGTSLVFVVNNKWLAETNDNSVSYGKVGFVLASYEAPSFEETDKSDEPQTYMPGADYSVEEMNKYSCKARLDFISIDTRIKSIEENYKKWTNDSNINAEGRLRLAETLAAMNEPVKALEQVHKAWKRRDQVIRTVSSAVAVRTKKELLFAARVTFSLGQFAEAEEYIDAILDQWPRSDEGKQACLEKIKILNELNRYKEIKDFIKKYPLQTNECPLEYHTILARCYWELKDYKNSAKTWDKAYERNKENGIYAVNAANAYESAKNNDKALMHFINAGKIFLNQDNIQELASVIPKLSLLGEKNWEARGLCGKWAFSIKDYDKCLREFEISNKLRCAIKPTPKADPAQFYLWGLVFYVKGKNKMAIRLLERAVKLAPDYELFRTKLEELKHANS